MKRTVTIQLSVTAIGLSLIVFGQVCLLAVSAFKHSPTWDEVGHLGAGVSHWELGDFSQYAVNPPLVRSVAALPVVLFMEPKLDWRDFNGDARQRTEVQVGRRLLNNNRGKIVQFFAVARWACIPFPVLGTLICYLWGRDLYGRPAGLLGAATWAYSPMVLGHGALITADVAAASVGLCAFYCLRLWLYRPTWSHAMLLGVMFGLALLCKSTWVISIGIVPVVWIGWRLLYQREHRLFQWRFGRDIVQLMVAFSLALLLLNAFYAFHGTFTRLEDYEFVSDELAGRTIVNRKAESGNRFRGTVTGKLPIPLPADFLMGIDLQKHDFQKAVRGKGYPSYLLGERRVGGWWYYYLVGYVLKEPVPWLIALTATITLSLCRTPQFKTPWWELAVLLLPSACIFVLVSSQTDMNRHLRYALPALPFVFIWTSQLAKLVDTNRRAVRVAVLGLTLWYIGNAFLVAPHHLSFFNLLAGGPENGHRVLVDSNLDWGQDLYYLKDWINEHPEAKHMRIAYFGCFDPALLGIDYEIPPPYFPPPDPRSQKPYLGPHAGWYAVSVNYLYGSTMPIPNSRNRFVYFGLPVYEYFQLAHPVDRAGNSIFIYHIKEGEAFDMRQELGLKHSKSVLVSDKSKK